MKESYVLLPYLPSTFGRLSQMATKCPYTRMAISLDDSYTHFYASSKLRTKTPPIPGYVEERRVHYTLGEDVPIQAKIFRVPVAEKGYAWAVAHMDEAKQDREITYNLLNMLLIFAFGGYPMYKAFHCGEFIAKVLGQAGVELEKPYYRHTPRLLAKLLGEYEISKGMLENDLSEGMEDGFFRETPRGEYLGKTCYIVRELLHRQMFHRVLLGLWPETVRFAVEDGKL